MIAENVTQAASVRVKFEARLCVGVCICGFVRAGGRGDPLGTCKGLVFFSFSKDTAKACRLVESEGFINLLYTFKLMMPPK